MRFTVFIILLASLGLSACQSCNPPTNSNNSNRNASNGNANISIPERPGVLSPKDSVDPKFKSCNAYFPLAPGSRVKYTVNYSSGVVADATVVVDRADAGGRMAFSEKTQIVDRSGGLQHQSMAEKLYVCDGERVEIIAETSTTRVPNSPVTKVDNTYRSPAVAILDPASLGRKGSTWSHSLSQTYQVPDQPPIASKDVLQINFTVIGPEQIKVPIGTFNTVKIERKVKETKIYEYYARGIGLVKRLAGDGTTFELAEYSGLTPQE